METQMKQNGSDRELQIKKILKMSGQELKEYIEKKILENPLIEMEESGMPVNKEEDKKRKLEWLEHIDESSRVLISKEIGTSQSENRQEEKNPNQDIIPYLEAQILTKKLDEKETEIMEYMLRKLDDKGYMKRNLDYISSKFSVPLEEVQRILNILQSLNPAGIGARNLEECLILQLERMETDETVCKQIVTECLDLVGTKQDDVIAEKMGLSEKEAKKHVEKIRKLNPKPAHGYASREKLSYIVPDITVVKLSEYFEILLNEYLYPGLMINTYYKDMLNQDCTSDTKDYIRTKIKEVEVIKEGIEKRNSLLVQITNFIVSRQQPFFINGEKLKPVSMKDVCEMFDVPEKTARLVVKGKYLQCLWGIYPITYFLTK